MNKNTRIDIMVDLETLGTDLNAVVFQIAASAFDIESGETIKEFNEFADISVLGDCDGKINGGTLKWWLQTNKELFTELLHKENERTSYDLFESFHDWLTSLEKEYGQVFLWGNGILFDNAIIRHKLTNYGLKYPIFFRNDRDVRTIFELAQIKTGESAKEMYERLYDNESPRHDAIIDVRNQISLVSECYRILTQ